MGSPVDSWAAMHMSANIKRKADVIYQGVLGYLMLKRPIRSRTVGLHRWPPNLFRRRAGQRTLCLGDALQHSAIFQVFPILPTRSAGLQYCSVCSVWILQCSHFDAFSNALSIRGLPSLERLDGRSLQIGRVSFWTTQTICSFMSNPHQSPA